MIFDNWCYQAILLLAAYFGTAAQQNMAVLSSIQGVFYQFVVGVQQASCFIVGNLIGANEVHLAQNMATLTFSQCSRPYLALMIPISKSLSTNCLVLAILY